MTGERPSATSAPGLARGSAVRVTVGLPTYNRAAVLRETLTALLTCDTRGLELDIRVVDDGSTDATREVVEDCARGAAGTLHVSYARQPKAGPAAARNHVARSSTAEFVAFLDDDCVPVRGWLQALLAGFTDRRVAAVGGRFVPAEARTAVARFLQFRGANEYPSPRRPFEFPFGGNCAYRRDVLLQFNGFDPAFRFASAEDVDLACRIKDHGFYRFAYAPEALVYDRNIETVRELLRRARQRGADQALRRVHRGTWRGATWVEVGRNMAALALQAVLLPTAGLRAGHFRRRGEIATGEALQFAYLAGIERLFHRWGRVTRLGPLCLGGLTWDAAARPDAKSGAGAGVDLDRAA